MKNLSIFRKMMGALAVVGLLSFTSCLKDGDPVVDTVAAAMAVNVVPGSEGLVLALDNNQLNNLGAGEVFAYSHILRYRRVYPGPRLLRVFHPDRVPNNQEILRKDVRFDNGEYYTLFVVGTDDEDMDVIRVADSLRTPNAGQAFLRFANMSPDAPALELGVVGRESLVATGTPFKSIADYATLSAGEKVKFFIREVGATEAFYEFEMDVKEKYVYTICAKGFFEEETASEDTEFGHGVISH
jgi:hypothetical protein